VTYLRCNSVQAILILYLDAFSIVSCNILQNSSISSLSAVDIGAYTWIFDTFLFLLFSQIVTSLSLVGLYPRSVEEILFEKN
jgi:hypothetical protein